MGGISEIFKGRWTIWIMSLAFSLLAGGGALAIIGQAADQTTYYVMAKDVAARTQVDPTMVVARTTSADGVPPTALSLDQIAAGDLFSLIPLRAGDVVTSSVVGTLKNLLADLPAGYVAAAIKVAPENAVGGRIRAGDLIDIASVYEGKAKIVLHRVRVLDVTVASEDIPTAANNALAATAPGPDSAVVRGGIPMYYQLAVTPQEFAILTMIKDGTMFLALSSNGVAGPLDVFVDKTTLFRSGSVQPSTILPGANQPNSSTNTTPAPTGTTTAPTGTTGTATSGSGVPAPAPSSGSGTPNR